MPQPPGATQNSARLFSVYHQQNVYGNLFHVATALAGVTLTTTGSTTQTFGLWNPAGNSRNFVPTKCRVGIVGATLAVASLTWTYLIGAGSGTAGTSAISAQTALTSVNGNLGPNAGTSQGLPGSSFTLAAAPKILRYFGASWGAPLATTAAVFPSLVDDFDGDVVIAPGSVLFLSCTTAPAGAVDISLSWIETPLVTF